MTRPAKVRALARTTGSTVTKMPVSTLELELEREQLARYLSELDRKHGPVPDAQLEKTRVAWRKRCPRQ